MNANEIDVSISDRTPLWTDKQVMAMVGLLKVRCQVNEKYCTNPWCTARNNIKKAFGISIPYGEK